MPTLGAVSLARLSPTDIADAFATLRRRGGKNGKPLSAATVHHAGVTLGKAMRAAVVSGALATSPIDRMTDEQKPASGTNRDGAKVRA